MKSELLSNHTFFSFVIINFGHDILFYFAQQAIKLRKCSWDNIICAQTHTYGLLFMLMALMFICGQLSPETLSPSADGMGAKTWPNPPAPIEVNGPPVTIFSELTLLSLN